MQETQETWVRTLGGEMPWRTAWQPAPVFLPGESHGQRSLVGHIQSIGLQRVGHDWSETFSFILWKVSIWNIYSISWMRKLRFCMGKNFKVTKEVSPFDHILCSTLNIKTGPFHKMWGLDAARNSGDKLIERLQTPRLNGIWYIK